MVAHTYDSSTWDGLKASLGCMRFCLKTLQKWKEEEERRKEGGSKEERKEGRKFSRATK